MMGFVEPRCSISEEQGVGAVVQDCGVRCDESGVAMVVVEDVIGYFCPDAYCGFIHVDKQCVSCN